jgi:hypothetical protein
MRFCNKNGMITQSGWGYAAVFLLLLAIAPEALAGGGWPRKKNGFYGKIGLASFRSNQYYSLLGELNNSGAQFRQTSLNLYAEYGITNRLTAVINCPFLRLNRFDNTGTTAGIGDVLVELKYGLFKNGLPISIGIAPSLPIGKSQALVENRNLPGNFINLPIGDGEFNVWTRLYASSSLGNRSYVSFDAGFNLRTQGFTNQYSAGLELGHKLFGKVWVNGILRRMATVGTVNTAKGSFVYGEGTEYLSYYLGASYEVKKHLSLTADYSNLLGSRKNVYSGPSIGLGIALELDALSFRK